MYYVTTPYYPTSARSFFPCFDEPEFKADVSLYVRYPLKFDIVSSNNIRYRQSGPILQLASVKRYYHISTRQISFLVSDFKRTEGQTTRGRKIRLWTNKDNLRNLVVALDVFKKVMEYIETYTDIKYGQVKKGKPSVKVFDFMVIPDKVDRFLNPEKLFINSETATPTNTFYVAFFAVQQLFYSWFGNLATESWNEPWLSNGIVTYMTYLGLENYKKNWNVNQLFVYETLQLGLREDSKYSTNPLYKALSGEPNEVKATFYSSVTFNKGASIMRMIRELVGPKVFQMAIREYLNVPSNKLVTEERLWNNFNLACEKNANEPHVKKLLTAQITFPGNKFDFNYIMSEWTHKKGYPVIKISLESKSDSSVPKRYKVVPKIFISDLDPSDQTYLNQVKSSKWNIPFWYTLSSTSNVSSLSWIKNTDESMTIPVNNDVRWIKANAGQKGFYRVNYEDENWASLTNQLEKSHKVFLSDDRFGLIDDAFALAEAKHLKMRIALGLTTYLYNEDDFAPFKVGIDRLEAIADKLLFTPTYKEYKKYIEVLVTPVLSRRQWNDTGNLQERRQREEVIRVLGYHGDETVKRISKSKLQKWITNKTPIESHLREHVLLTAIKYGGKSEWDFLWKKYKDKTTEPRDRKIILKALAATKDNGLLNRLLNYSLSEKEIATEDILTMIDEVSKHCSGRKPALSFFINNFKLLHRRIGGSDCYLNFAERYGSEDDYCEVKKFLQANEDIFGSFDLSHKALKAIQANIEWVNYFQDDVLNFLKNIGKKMRDEEAFNVDA